MTDQTQVDDSIEAPVDELALLKQRAKMMGIAFSNNISLDTLDPERFEYITGRGKLEKTLRAIELAAASGIKTKINTLLQKEFNEDELPDIASLAFKYGIDVRFIEMMPVGVADAGTGLSNLRRRPSGPAARVPPAFLHPRP